MADHLALWKAAGLACPRIEYTSLNTAFHEGGHSVAMLATVGECGYVHNIADARTLGKAEFGTNAFPGGIDRQLTLLMIYAAGDIAGEMFKTKFEAGDPGIFDMGLASMLDGPHRSEPMIDADELRTDARNAEANAEIAVGDFSRSLLPATAKAEAMQSLIQCAKVRSQLMLIDCWPAVLALAALIWKQRLVSGGQAKEIFDLMTAGHQQLFRERWFPYATPAPVGAANDDPFIKWFKHELFQGPGAKRRQPQPPARKREPSRPAGGRHGIRPDESAIRELIGNLFGISGAGRSSMVRL